MDIYFLAAMPVVVALIILQGITYVHVVKKCNESRNLSCTKDGLLKQMKLKYENLWKLEMNVNDIDFFISGFLKKDTVFNIKITDISLVQVAGRLLIACAGVGSIIGKSFWSAVGILLILELLHIFSDTLNYKEVYEKIKENAKNYLIRTYDRSNRDVNRRSVCIDMGYTNEPESRAEESMADKEAAGTQVIIRKATGGIGNMDENTEESGVHMYEKRNEAVNATAINELFYEFFGI